MPGSVGVLNYGGTAAATDRLDLRIENLPKMTILGDGRVGIGTVAPKLPPLSFLGSTSTDIDGTLYVGSGGKSIVSSMSGAGASVPNVLTIYSWDNVTANHTDLVLRASSAPQIYLSTNSN